MVGDGARLAMGLPPPRKRRVAGWAPAAPERMVHMEGNTPSRERAREVDTAMDQIADAAAPGDRMARWKARRPRQGGASNGGGAVYGLGMIGAVAYFFGSAESGRDYALAGPKAVFWPALIVYKLLKNLYG